MATAWDALTLIFMLFGAMITSLGYTTIRYSHSHVNSIYDFIDGNELRMFSQRRLAGRLLTIIGWIMQGFALTYASQILVVLSTVFCVALNWIFSVGKCRSFALQEDFDHVRPTCGAIPTAACLVSTSLVGVSLVLLSLWISTQKGSNNYNSIQKYSEETEHLNHPNFFFNSTEQLHQPIWHFSLKDVDADKDLFLVWFVCFVSFFTNVAILMIDDQDHRIIHYERICRLEQCETDEDSNEVENHIANIDLAVGGQVGGGATMGRAWQYRAEILGICAGAWSAILYTLSKLLFSVLFQIRTGSGSRLMCYLVATMSSAGVMLHLLERAMKGDQGNAVILLLMNSVQVMFSVYGSIFVFDHDLFYDKASILLWSFGMCFIVLGIITVFVKMDAPRRYVKLSRKEQIHTTQVLMDSFTDEIEEFDEPPVPQSDGKDAELPSQKASVL